MTSKLVVVVVVFTLSVLLRLPSAASFTIASLVQAFHHRRMHISRHDYCDRIPFLTAADKSGDTTESNDETNLYDTTNDLNAVSFNKGKLLTVKFKKARNLAQQFVDSIMSATVDPIPESPDSNGMAVVRNVVRLESNRTRDIILRSITVPFWQACIDGVNTPDLRVAAIGTPGIGKTTSTPWLIRMLLEQGQTVVYLVRTENKKDWYNEFVPNSDGTITANVYPEKDEGESIPSLDCSSTYYIVDPGKSKDNCDPPTKFSAKVILVSSPDSGHWGGSEFTKERDGVVGEFRYFPTWSCEELLLARPILRPDMTEDQVRERFRQFGGVPRHVFRLQIKDYLEAQDNAVSALTAKQGNDIARGRMNALDKFGTEAKSALLAFRLSDDDNGTFENGEPYIVSELASEKIYISFENNLWNGMLQLGPTGGGGIIFEMITRHRIATGKPAMKFAGRRCVGKDDEEYSKPLFLTLGTGKKEIRQVTDPLQAAVMEANVVFHPISLNNRLFDFVYKNSTGHFHIFQVTMGKSHTANVEHIKALEGTVGDASKMSFYFLIPSERFLGFVTTPVKPAVACDVYHVMIPKPVVEQREATESDGDDQSRGDSENGRESPRGAKEQREATEGNEKGRESPRGANEQREATDGDEDERSGGNSKEGRKIPQGTKGKKTTAERKRGKQKRGRGNNAT